MIQNLPEEIDATVVSLFDFGSTEARKDELLWDCFCQIPPIKTFMQDRRSIIIGAKGSGKTAVFTLIKKGRLQFESTNKDKTCVTGIDEPVEYAKATTILSASLKSKIKDKATRYRYLWEVYLLYKICLAIKDRSDLQVIHEKAKTICQLFATEQQQLTFLQILTSTRKTIGFKLDMSNPAFPSPDFYFTTEPSDKSSEKSAETDHQNVVIDIEAYKNDIEAALSNAGVRLYILVDSLDDFVANDDYKTQKQILQGILNCCMGYSKLKFLRVKVSIRADLFHRLDFSQMGGYDKIAPDVIELSWTDSDIRYFIARRLAFNIMATLRLKGLKLSFEEHALYLPPPESKRSYWERTIHQLSKLFRKVDDHDENDARTVTARDQISREVILTLFPKEVCHHTSNGARERCELFTFLASHFDLGDGHPTPRIILMFLDKLAHAASIYYNGNLDERLLKRTENNYFPLFKRDHFADAYQSLQLTMLDVFKSCMTMRHWQAKIDTFFMRKGKRDTFSYSALKKIMDFDETEDPKGFIAYLVHLGILRCRDSHVPYENRQYDLPVLLQHVWSAPK